MIGATHTAPAATPPQAESLLPVLLLLLTAVSGVVDASSFLKLGRVFVANMTGNVVFLGFAVAGSTQVSLTASLLAIVAFLVGGVISGRLIGVVLGGRLALLRTSLQIEFVLVVAAAGLSLMAGADPSASAWYYVLIGLLAIAMGIQNATARRLAVPDLTTTVLTMTLTGIAADSRLAGGSGSRIRRRGLAVAAMLLGAILGGFLVLRVALVAALGLAAVLLATTAMGAQWISSSRRH